MLVTSFNECQISLLQESSNMNHKFVNCVTYYLILFYVHCFRSPWIVVWSWIFISFIKEHNTGEVWWCNWKQLWWLR